MSRKTIVLKGFMPPGREKFYHDVPFEMPPGVSRLEVHYQYSDAISPDPQLTGGNTVDIGLFDWRGDTFLHAGFRGWTGSARSEFYLTPTEATPGYLPGPLSPGTWHVALGFYKVGPDGCQYRVEVTFEFGETAAVDFPPMLKLNSPNAHIPARPGGWYKGELHCHTVHSDGDSQPAEVIAQAESLGLDFLAITDHNNITHLVELSALGRQNIVLIPGYEVTTYRGHWNIWGPDTWIDFRVLAPDDMQRALWFAREHAYLVSCNHPRRFGPPWEYEETTGYQCVEVWNGPWPLFNNEGLAFWEERLKQGQRLSAVGGSDMHRLHTEHHARIGVPTTWIYCPGEPTAEGLLSGLRAGHAFISDAPDGPQLYLSSGEAIMGDVIPRPASNVLAVKVRVVSGSGHEVQLVGTDGCLHKAPVERDEQEFEISIPIANTPYIRAQLVIPDSEDLVMRALTNPIYLD